MAIIKVRDKSGKVVGIPAIRGERGEKGDSGVYVGSGEMPDGYNIQIDPNGEGSPLEYNTPQMFVTPQMFGAVGDNITDDTEAFKKCFEHTNIYIPAGKYVVSETLSVLPRTNVTGDGQYMSFITNKNSDAIFDIEEYASFSDINICGNDKNTAIRALRSDPSSPYFKQLRLHNIRFRYLDKGVYSDATQVLYNTFTDCTFQNVDYPFIFPNAEVFNTSIISNCEFKSYTAAVTTGGTIYSINFDRCIFEGGKIGDCVVDALQCVNTLFSSCYYENYGSLISNNVLRGNIVVRDTWIYESDRVVLSRETHTDAIMVKFVDSTIENANRGEEGCGFLIDGTNIKVNLVDCMTKRVGDTHLIPIDSVDIASQCGVATNCKINGGYLTLDTLPST